MSEQQSATIQLPSRLVTHVDLARTLRELRGLDDWLNQSALRAGGQAVTPPKTSATLEELAEANGVSLLDASQRGQLIQVLSSFMDHAPRLNISFAVEPTPKFLQELIVWMRSNINPVMVVDVGMQPTLAAGCMVRTQNKMFDMSLRNRLKESREALIQSIASMGVASPVEQVSEPVAAVPEQPAPPAPPAVTQTAQPQEGS